jgi:hypothetical protein
MPSAGFEPAILATGRPQAQTSDRATTEIGLSDFITWNIEHGFIRDRVTNDFPQLQ